MSAATAVRAHAPKQLAFVRAMLGFTGHTDFELEPLDDSALLYSLNSRSESGPRLFVLDPTPFFPAYRPTLDPAVSENLGCAEPALLVVVTVGQDASGHTANLLAPIAFNALTGAAQQVVLEDDTWPLRATFG